MNKCDIRRMNELADDRRVLFEQFERDNVPVVEMSTLTKEGLIDLRNMVSFHTFRKFNNISLIIGMRSFVGSTR